MEFEQILKLVDHVSASHLESFCYESDGVKLTLNNKIAPVIIPGTMQNNILSGAETGEKGFVYGEKKCKKPLDENTILVYYTAMTVIQKER